MGDATRETTIDVARDGEMTGREDRMTVRYWLAAAAALAATAFPSGLAAETLKIASPIRGSWEGAIPELGKQAGIFQKYGSTSRSSIPRAAARRCRSWCPARSMSA
jgi:hypothetical protein